jgi:hypothetical protein
MLDTSGARLPRCNMNCRVAANYGCGADRMVEQLEAQASLLLEGEIQGIQVAGSLLRHVVIGTLAHVCQILMQNFIFLLVSIDSSMLHPCRAHVPSLRMQQGKRRVYKATSEPAVDECAVIFQDCYYGVEQSTQHAGIRQDSFPRCARSNIEQHRATCARLASQRGLSFLFGTEQSEHHLSRRHRIVCFVSTRFTESSGQPN